MGTRSTGVTAMETVNEFVVSIRDVGEWDPRIIGIGKGRKMD